ncbi:recombination mediator RecR [Fusibacter sp. JL298sf-3]
MKYIPAISRLIDEFAQLPGIGRKTAQRLAFYIIDQDLQKAESFAKALVDAKRNVHFCDICFNLTEEETCDICRDAKRDATTLCVVESTRDLYAIEGTKEFHGKYHVLHGAISPMDGVGPNEIKLRELIVRLQNEAVDEVILATNPTIEGEATAMYISKLLKGTDIRVTRLAHGIPVGGDLEYADQVTLAKSLENRRVL